MHSVTLRPVRLIAAAAAIPLPLVAATPAFAHVKWFAPYIVDAPPMPIAATLTNLWFWTAIVLVTVFFLATRFLEDKPVGQAVTGVLDKVSNPLWLRLDDFVRASVYGRKKWVSSRLPKARDKGQNAELAAFIKAVRTGGPMPVPLESLVATTAATLAVQTGLAGGVPVTLARSK